MVALRVKLNGKELCLAGAEDLSVLTTNVTAVGNLGKKTRKMRDEPPGYHVSTGGLTSRDAGNDWHLRWVESQPLTIGDKIEIELVEVTTTDKPISKSKAKRDNASTGKA